MIRSYRDRDTKRLAARERVKRFQAIEDQARVKLRILNTAQTLQDLSLPGLRLEKLHGDRAGQHSIRVNDQYRLCFRWKDNEPYDVELTLLPLRRHAQKQETSTCFPRPGPAHCARRRRPHR